MIKRVALAGLLASLLLFAQGNPSDDKIYDLVRLKLAGSQYVNGGGIEVVVQNGAVTLKGKVMKDKQKEKATGVAKKVKGVKSVDNQLVVEYPGQK